MTFIADPVVKISDCPASSCRYCIHYTPSGRRGGHCQQLGVPVRSCWKACPLALPTFASSWEHLETNLEWQDEVLAAENILLNFNLVETSSDYENLTV